MKNGVVLALSSALAASCGDARSEDERSLLALYTAVEKSEIGLAEYAADMRKAQRILAGSAEAKIVVTVTFAGPISAESLATIIDEDGLQVAFTYFHALRGEELMTLVHRGRPHRGLAFEAAGAAEAEQASLLGAVAMTGWIAPQAIERVQSRAEVFLVDVSAASFASRDPAAPPKFIPSFAWDLARLR